jgi:hypothetical protein
MAFPWYARKAFCGSAQAQSLRIQESGNALRRKLDGIVQVAVCHFNAQARRLIDATFVSPNSYLLERR